MSELKTLPVRLALRVEGDWWVAYIAEADTMDGAKRIGSILMGIVEDKKRKRAFMDLMRSAVDDAIKEADNGAKTTHWHRAVLPRKRRGQGEHEPHAGASRDRRASRGRAAGRSCSPNMA